MTGTYDHDVIVVGLGVMGSAIAAEIAADGHRVLGVERFGPAHDRGSSGGESRMLRRVHPEQPWLTSLTGPAREAWKRLEQVSGERLFLTTGGLLVGRRGSAAVTAAAAAAGEETPHPVPYRLLSSAHLREAYPALRFADDAEGFLDEQAGILLAEPCVRAFQEQARRAGARLRFGTPVDPRTLLATWKRERAVVVGDVRATASALVVAPGPWITELAGTGLPRFWTERTVSHWLDPGPYATALDPARMPFVEWEDPRGEFCMLPALDGGVKVKFHHTGERATPEPGPRAADAGECTAARTRLAELAGLPLRHRRAQASLYTNTPGGRFVIERHPTVPDVVVVSACSGHGFKFAPIVAARTALLAAGKAAA